MKGILQDLGISESTLNFDIKDYGPPILSSEIKKDVSGKVILQIQKVRNISAPKGNADSQVAPPLSKLVLTDGHTYCQAVEIVPVPWLICDQIIPGSKVLINNARVVCGCILLTPDCSIFLGGKVPLLYEKWELSKSVSSSIRNSGASDAAPPWVNFGHRIVTSPNDHSFKSLQNKKDEGNKDSAGFNVQRQEAIAEVATGAVKKVFGGGIRTFHPPPNVKPRFTRDKSDDEPRFYEQTRDRNKDVKMKREGKDKNEEKVQKPEKISLFDFFENKLPVGESQKDNASASFPNKPNKNYYSSENFQNNKLHKKQGYYKLNKVPATQQQYQQQYEQQPINSRSYERQDTKYRNNKLLNNTAGSLDNISENFSKVSLNAQFASKSLRNYLKVDSAKNIDPKFKAKNWIWNVGDHCMAKYWEDSKYYNAVVTDLTDRTCVVKFRDYPNIEEVLKTDCIAISGDGKFFNQNETSFRGSSHFKNSNKPQGFHRSDNKY